MAQAGDIGALGSGYYFFQSVFVLALTMGYLTTLNVSVKTLVNT